MKTNVSGVFVKILPADEIGIFLVRNSPDRPAARFNRLGQDALYLSADEESARVAMRKYAKDSDPRRMLIQYEVQSCQLVDLRHTDNAALRQLASQDWQDALQKGSEPTSWQVSDALRKSGEVGLIDPSRKHPSSWHVTLLRWNEPHAPCVSVVGEPTELRI